ncbi:YihY/virulence factor BrkB family protein [Luteitalea sp.]
MFASLSGRDDLKHGSTGHAEVIIRTLKNFVRHEMSTYAAALAYRGLLAFFPFAIFFIALANSFDAWRLFDILGEWARMEPQGRVPAAIKGWLVTQTRERASPAVVSMGAMVAVWAVGSGARLLRRALAVAAQEPEVHPPWKRLAISLVAAPLLAGAILSVVLLLTVTQRVLWRLGGWIDLNDAVVFRWDWLRLPVGSALAALLLSVVYLFLSPERHPGRSVLPGAGVATVVWTGASILLPLAVSSGLKFGVSYGSFTAAIALLVYLYVAAMGLLFGAELNAALRIGPPGRRE